MKQLLMLLLLNIHQLSLDEIGAMHRFKKLDSRIIELVICSPQEFAVVARGVGPPIIARMSS